MVTNSLVLDDIMHKALICKITNEQILNGSECHVRIKNGEKELGQHTSCF